MRKLLLPILLTADILAPNYALSQAGAVPQAENKVYVRPSDAKKRNFSMQVGKFNVEQEYRESRFASPIGDSFLLKIYDESNQRTLKVEYFNIEELHYLQLKSNIACSTYTNEFSVKGWKTENGAGNLDGNSWAQLRVISKALRRAIENLDEEEMDDVVNAILAVSKEVGIRHTETSKDQMCM